MKKLLFIALTITFIFSMIPQQGIAASEANILTISKPSKVRPQRKAVAARNIKATEDRLRGGLRQRCNQVRQELTKYGLAGSLLDYWVRIADDESDCRDKVTNPTTPAGGVYQIMPTTWLDYCGEDPKWRYFWRANIWCAVERIYPVQGFSAWEVTK